VRWRGMCSPSPIGRGRTRRRSSSTTSGVCGEVGVGRNSPIPSPAFSCRLGTRALQTVRPEGAPFHGARCHGRVSKESS
jgi:hypothetical protein